MRLLEWHGELVSEGFCPYGHGPLAVAELHGELAGACAQCECSWQLTGGQVWGCACIPGLHTCGEGRPS